MHSLIHFNFISLIAQLNLQNNLHNYYWSHCSKQMNNKYQQMSFDDINDQERWEKEKVCVSMHCKKKFVCAKYESFCFYLFQLLLQLFMTFTMRFITICRILPCPQLDSCNVLFLFMYTFNLKVLGFTV